MSPGAAASLEGVCHSVVSAKVSALGAHLGRIGGVSGLFVQGAVWRVWAGISPLQLDRQYQHRPNPNGSQCMRNTSYLINQPKCHVTNIRKRQPMKRRT